MNAYLPFFTYRSGIGEIEEEIIKVDKESNNELMNFIKVGSEHK